MSQWVRTDAEGNTIRSDEMPWLTWKQSAEQLKRALFGFECDSPSINHCAGEVGQQLRHPFGAGH